MNTPNNKRKKESQNKIESVFLELAKTHDLDSISVTTICSLAKINRCTFYANYIDMNDLIDKVKMTMFKMMMESYDDTLEASINNHNYLPLFKSIYNNQELYKLLYKLGYDYQDYANEELERIMYQKYYSDDKNRKYHQAFFSAGFKALVKLWLENDCKESPEVINNVLVSEYSNK